MPNTFSLRPPPPVDPVAAKLAELDAACAAEIVGGYTSSALGSAYTYPSQGTDQRNMNVSVTASLLPNLPAGWTTPFKCADASGVWALRPHTVVQIQQAGQDGMAAIVDAQIKLEGLQAQVAAATTPDQLAAITW